MHAKRRDMHDERRLPCKCIPSMAAEKCNTKRRIYVVSTERNGYYRYCLAYTTTSGRIGIPGSLIWLWCRSDCPLFLFFWPKQNLYRSQRSRAKLHPSTCVWGWANPWNARCQWPRQSCPMARRRWNQSIGLAFHETSNCRSFLCNLVLPRFCGRYKFQLCSNQFFRSTFLFRSRLDFTHESASSAEENKLTNLNYSHRADSICRFFLLWAPEVYGELTDEDLSARGFELITQDLEWEEPVRQHRPKPLKKLKLKKNRPRDVAGVVAGDPDQDEEDDDPLNMTAELAKESWEVSEKISFNNPS